LSREMAPKNERVRYFLETYGSFLVGLINVSMLTASIVNLCMAVALPLQFSELFVVNVLRPWATASTVWLSSFCIGGAANSLLASSIRYARVGRERIRANEFQNANTLQMLSVNRWTLMFNMCPCLLLCLCCYWNLVLCPCYEFRPSIQYSNLLRIGCLRLTQHAFLMTLFAFMLQLASFTFTLTVKHFAKMKAIKNA
ncbi:hypothetical protein BOX15_Mlig030532g1, partial [Macrostomum lignano]